MQIVIICVFFFVVVVFESVAKVPYNKLLTYLASSSRIGEYSLVRPSRSVS